MPVLHASLAWRGLLRNQCEVLLWAEASSASIGPARRRRPGARSPTPHPFALGAGEVERAIRELSAATRSPAPGFHREIARLHLPSRAGAPISSHGPADDTGSPTPARAWAVPVVRIPYAEALPWLAALPAGAESEELPRIGGDLRYLSRVAKFVFALLLRRKIVPTLVELPGKAPQARWSASLTTDEELAEGQRLKELTPMSLLAAREESGYLGAGSLIRALLDAGVDGLARAWLADSPAAPRQELPEGRWADALTRISPHLHVPVERGRELRQGVEAWTGVPTDEPPRYRTCFRLADSAELPEEAAAPADTAPPVWRVEALLQARDDLSLFVPALEALRDPRSIPSRPGTDPDRVAEQFLADLRRAGAVYPPLAGLLAQRRPSTLAFSTEAAYEFLHIGTPLLHECGFGVLAPPWWETRRAPIGARLRVRPAQAEGDGTFGLEGLVDYDLDIALGEGVVSRDELERLAELKVPLVRWRGQWVEVRAEDVAAALQALDRRRAGRLPLRELLGADVDGRFGELPLLGVVPSPELRELWGALRGEVRFQEVLPPAALRAELRPYQATGYSWLTFCRRLGLGACLADDMGLGKTVQCLSLLVANRASEDSRHPSLLVCPTSVVENWRREAARFAPTLVVRLHHGEGRPRTVGRFRAAARRADLLVTSYALLWRDAELLSSFAWDTVVLDEAQNIKNPLARASQAAVSLRSRHRIALTGTPIENRLSELWSIMQFLNPGLLGPLATFESRFAVPIERFSDAGAAQTLQRLTRPLLLRRLKSDPRIVPELPAKIETRSDCILTREQATLYEATVREMMARIETTEGMGRRALVLSTLTKLKQLCDHPALFLKDRSAVAGRSGKLERLEELLEEALAAGDSALVFTQWREMGELLRRRLSERFGCDVGFFHGGLSLPAREQLLGSFRAGRGARILVLTLKAGGSGINLTEANRVFHFDRWWNPAVESQATDRSYRIGQLRRVMVHKLVVVGTVEEKIDELLRKKTGLAESVLSHGEAALTELSTADLRELFSLRTGLDAGSPESPGDFAPAGG